MKNSSQIITENECLRFLDSLRRVPARKQSKLAEGRLSFLEEAKRLALLKPGSTSDSLRGGFTLRIMNIISMVRTGKEARIMVMKFSIAALLLALIFGSVATAVQAAEGSFPGQVMYPLKIMVEDIQAMIASPDKEVQHSTQRVESRIHEILRLREQNLEIPESAYVRVENQLEQTLRLMLGLADEDLLPTLLQVQSRFMLQECLLQGLQSQGGGSEDAAPERLRAMLQARLRLIDAGINDLQQFKAQVRERDRDRDSWSDDENPPANGQGTSTSSGPGPLAGTPTGRAFDPGPIEAGSTTTPGAFGPGPGPAEKTATSGAYGPGPGPVENTPTPGAYGPGLGPVGNTPTPGAYGPGPGPVGNTPTPGAYGPGPGQVENTPTPGDYGPGPGPVGNTPTPGAYGPGPGPMENTPTPGDYGPGPGPAENTPTPGAYGPGATPTPPSRSR